MQLTALVTALAASAIPAGIVYLLTRLLYKRHRRRALEVLHSNDELTEKFAAYARQQIEAGPSEPGDDAEELQHV